MRLKYAFPENESAFEEMHLYLEEFICIWENVYNSIWNNAYLLEKALMHSIKYLNISRIEFELIGMFLFKKLTQYFL